MATTIADLGRECVAVYNRAAVDHSDLWGMSLLDLMADQISDITLDQLKEAIVVSDLRHRVNDRLKQQIERYEREMK